MKPSGLLSFSVMMHLSVCPLTVTDLPEMMRQCVASRHVMCWCDDNAIPKAVEMEVATVDYDQAGVLALNFDAWRGLLP